MKKIKKLLVGLLAAVTAFSATSFVGCGGPGGRTDIDENEDVEVVTILRNEFESVNTARKQNTPIYAAFKKAVGVDVEAISASVNLSEMLSKLWLSQELPDIFLCEGPDSPVFYEKLIKGGDIIAIDDYVNEETKDEYPNLYEVMKRTSYLAKNLSYAKGKQWAIPSAWELEKSLYVRQDWIDNLNAKLPYCLVQEGVITSEAQYTEDMYEQYKYGAPETLIDFYRLARAFTLYEPDNDPSKKTYGYESEANLDMDAWAYVAFGAGWHAEMKDPATGKYIASEISDASMKATSFLSRLIAEGYMSPNSITNSNASKQTSFARGGTGMIFAHNWLNTFVNDMLDTYDLRKLGEEGVKKATSMILMCDPPKGETGAYGADAGYDNFWQFMCINANMSQKRIKKCLEIFDFMYSDEGRFLFQYGVEGVDFDYVKDEQGNILKDETFPELDKKVCLKYEDEPTKFSKGVGITDSAYQLYSMSWWSGHYYNETGTNGYIIAERQRKSSAYGYKVDYPYIQTELYLDKIETLRDRSEEIFVEIYNDARGSYWGMYLEENPNFSKFNLKEFGWDDINFVPPRIVNRWERFVKEFNEDMGGAKVYKEYNDYIDSGKAQKKTEDGPIYANCGSFYRD